MTVKIRWNPKDRDQIKYPLDRVVWYIQAYPYRPLLNPIILGYLPEIANGDDITLKVDLARDFEVIEDIGNE